LSVAGEGKGVRSLFVAVSRSLGRTGDSVKEKWHASEGLTDLNEKLAKMGPIGS